MGNIHCSAFWWLINLTCYLSEDTGNTKYMYVYIFMYLLTIPSFPLYYWEPAGCLCCCWDLVNCVTANVLLGEILPCTSFLFTFIKKHTILRRLSNQRALLRSLSITTLAMLTRSRSFQTTVDLFKAPSVPQSVSKLIYRYSVLRRTCSLWPHINQKFRNTAINAFYCSTDDVYRDKLTLKTVPGIPTF